MATLVKTGIGDGQTLTPIHITELYDAFTGDKLFDNLIINNSMKVTHDGRVTISKPGASKSAPYQLNVDGTLQAGIGIFDQIIVTTAQYVTSSVLIVTGSNFFGSTDTDLHTFTGSLLISGGIDHSSNFLNKVTIGSSTAVLNPNVFGVVGGSKFTGPITGSDLVLSETASVGRLVVTGDALFEGEINIGDAATDSVSFGAEINSHLIPDNSQSFNLGSSTKKWNIVYGETASFSYIEFNGNSVISGSMSSTGSFGRVTVGDDLHVHGTASIGYMEFTDFVSIQTASIDNLNFKDLTVNSLTASEGQLLRQNQSGSWYYDYADRTSVVGKNVGGSTLGIGTPVSIFSYIGNNVYGIRSARSDVEQRRPAIGVLTKQLAHEESGSIILSGLFRSYDLDTSAYSAGTKLYLGSSELTHAKPTAAGNLSQVVGVVLKSSAVNGEILIIAGGGGGQTEVLNIDNIFFGSGSTTENIHISGALDRTTVNNITGVGTASFGRVEVSGNSNFTGDVTIGGNINIGDADTDSLTISADLSSSLIPDADSIYDLGSSTKYWRNQYVDSITATGNISSSAQSTASFGHVKIPDDGRLSIGKSNDLQIYHNGNHTHIAETGTGNLILRSNAFQVKNAANNEVMIQANEDGAVTLFYDNTQRLVTTPGGLNITGNITGSGDLKIAGNITGSATSTGSIAHQHIANNLGIGILSPLATVHISASDGLIIPVGNTSQRSSNAIKGEIRFNDQLQTYEGYDGSNWGSLGGMNDVDQDTKILAETSAGSDNDELQFYTAGSERLRIYADGHISASGDITGSGNLKIIGNISSSTMTVSSTLTSSTAITTNNITNGYPTSNNWQDNLVGSYFNNFDHTTHVSEILRFMAGVISHSIDTSAPTANLKYWDTVSTTHTQGSTTSKSSLLNGVLGSSYENARLSNSWTGSAYIDLSETGSYRAVQDYLELKGWVQSSDRGTNDNDVGTNPFHGSYASRIPSTIQTNASFDTLSHTVTANAGGSSAIYSNSNYFGLGTLTSGGATAYSVRVLASQSFSDNYADSTPDKNSTFHTSSLRDYTQSSFGTSNGLILAKINTAQPAVIPAAFQDGDFNSVSGPLSGRFHHTGSQVQNTISASGYYQMQDIKVGLKSGSQSDFIYKDGSNSTNRFYLYVGSLPTDITDGAPTPSISKDYLRTSFSATSRSLSGAPYLLTTAYGFTYSARATNCFDPCYGYNSSPLVNSKPTDTWDNIGSTSLSNTTVSVTNSGVQSTGASTYVISSDFTTKRTSNQIPHTSDVSVASSSFTFSLDSNSSNVVSARSTQESLNYSLTFRTTAKNWKNSNTTSTTSAISFYDASLFGQPSSSGSMAVYSRAQGYDSNTLADTTETFTGEDFRIELEDKVQQFNGDYFTTDSYKTNDNGDAVLGDYDLQVKPGYLVDPGGTRGYWFPANFGSGTYKYYIRRFQKSTSGTKTSMTINLGSSLVAWNSTSNGVACAILFESSGNGSGNNSSLGVARIYDPTKLTSNLIEANMAQDNFKNPFSTAISLYGNSGGSLSSTEYTIPIRNADGMYLDASDNELYVIIRYKGDPSPVTSITLSYS